MSCGQPGYRFLVDPSQVYTIAPHPLWQNAQGYNNFVATNARTGNYQSLPWGVFNPLFVSQAMGYYSGQPYVTGPWVKTDARKRPFVCHWNQQ